MRAIEQVQLQLVEKRLELETEKEMVIQLQRSNQQQAATHTIVCGSHSM